jgi:hypothetical protein
MRRPLACAFAAATLAGCTGGGGGGGGTISTLDDGIYTVTSAGVVADPCGLFPQGNGYYMGVATVEVTVTGDDVEIEGFADPLDYEVSGNEMHDPSSPGENAAELDFNDEAVAVTAFGLLKPYDCVLDLRLEYRGLVTAPNEFTLGDEYTLSEDDGDECGAVATSSGAGAYPCTSIDGADLAL